MEINGKESLFEYVNNRKRFCELTTKEQIREAEKIEDMYRFLLFYLERDLQNFTGRETVKLLKPQEAQERPQSCRPR